MKNIFTFALILLTLSVVTAQNNFEQDIIKTKSGELKITFIGHGTLMFEYDNLVIHIDPVGRYADYSKLQKADLILITHQHGDHLDPAAIGQILKEETKIFCNLASLEKAPGAEVLKNGDKTEYKGISIETVPAYNLVHKRDNGHPFHPKGEGNGYVLTIGGKKIYIAGDTENVPEMKDLENIDIAFLPMNLPYTMTPQMVADAVKMFNPKILYPYHYGNTNVSELDDLLKGNKECEIRIRKLN
ncbi:MAG: MBL fold metallo-hydrolase [Melioribacteraceae bacterium]|nr:MBL fold metallo-hydrolase [Melioribacteraceae bacterium]